MLEVSVERLFRSLGSGGSPTVVLPPKVGGPSVHIIMPEQKARILALEAHGLNDRCSIYRMLQDILQALGGSLEGVVIRCVPNEPVLGFLGVGRDAGAPEPQWLAGDVAELLALALRLGLPLYLARSEAEFSPRATNGEHNTDELPEVFRHALEELSSGLPSDFPE